MTVRDWSQSIYLLTDLQLVQGMFFFFSVRKKNREREEEGRQVDYRKRGSERVDRWRVRGL